MISYERKKNEYNLSLEWLREGQFKCFYFISGLRLYILIISVKTFIKYRMKTQQNRHCNFRKEIFTVTKIYGDAAWNASIGLLLLVLTVKHCVLVLA